MARLQRRILIGAVVAAILIAIAAVVLPRTQVFAVEEIAVEGAVQLSPEEVEAATGIVNGTPIGAVNTHDAAVGVAGLPWVESVTVTRSWPSTIEVELTEHTAVAFVSEPDGSHLINAQGEVFAVDDPPAGAVEITGAAAGDDAVLAGGVAVASSISGPSREAVESIEARSPNTFVLKLKDGRTVVWGASENNANKALALETVLQREGQEFNISNPQQVTVR